MYDGTRSMRDFAPERCSAPKAANGMAKHKLVRAAILSRPRAWAISFFAANRPITSSDRTAADIEKAEREKSKNAARRFGCMDLPIGTAPRILRQSQRRGHPCEQYGRRKHIADCTTILTVLSASRKQFGYFRIPRAVYTVIPIANALALFYDCFFTRPVHIETARAKENFMSQGLGTAPKPCISRPGHTS